jgi:tripartite-type tricarboxylate transporter receptor subunit TctC
MKLPHRRHFLHLAAGAAALPAVPRIAQAQAYPTRPVRIVVGFVPGNPPDIFARLIGQWLSERLDQSFVVDNRPGASGTIGTEVVVRSPPDGYTLLATGMHDVISPMLYEKLSYNFARDIAPVATLIRQPLVMVVHPSFPAKTVPEFIAHAKANPGKVNMASAGNGTPPHLFGALFQAMAAVNMVHVPYRGGAPALTGLIGGQVHIMFVGPAVAIDHLKSGRLHALAVTTATRWDALPNIPAVGEFLPGYEASSWVGIGAPKDLPAEIVEKLNKEINAGIADPKLQARLAGLGGTPLFGSPADFGKLIADETEKWGKVIRAANIKPE